MFVQNLYFNVQRLPSTFNNDYIQKFQKGNWHNLDNSKYFITGERNTLLATSRVSLWKKQKENDYLLDLDATRENPVNKTKATTIIFLVVKVDNKERNNALRL